MKKGKKKEKLNFLGKKSMQQILILVNITIFILFSSFIYESIFGLYGVNAKMKQKRSEEAEERGKGGRQARTKMS